MEDVVTITDSVQDKAGRPRWIVVATFTGAGGTEPRCVDYRVRVVPRVSDGEQWFPSYVRLMQAMEEDAAGPDDDYGVGPSEGIPGFVFERASQSRLLEKAREKATRRPDLVAEQTAQILARQSKPRRGRPPARSLREKLLILSACEKAFADGGTLEDVASEHAMSRSAVRDLLAWGRSEDSGTQLFEGTTPGRRGGRMTPAGRALLEETEVH